MIHYRSFRNPDPPLVCQVWNAAVAGRRATSLRSTTLLEFFTLAKPYFDPRGLLLALDDEQPVGLAHAGFVGNADGSDVDRSTGVVCVVAVVPSHRRRGIGSELLRRAEQYLRDEGATVLEAGPIEPHNPFTFGIYGGSVSAGFLESDAAAAPFLERHGYRPVRSCGLYRRLLEKPVPLTDNRFVDIRQRHDIVAAPYGHAGWWRECVLGPIEAVEYRLQEKGGGRAVARTVLWDMETFASVWGQSCVGMLELWVDPAVRRQGLARYLLAQVLRHLRDQPFQLFEAGTPDDPAAVGLLRSLDFHLVETGHAYRRA